MPELISKTIHQLYQLSVADHSKHTMANQHESITLCLLSLNILVVIKIFGLKYYLIIPSIVITMINSNVNNIIFERL